MGIVTYVLIGLYAVLTGLAGVIKWKETGFQIRSFLFVVVSIAMLVTLFLPNPNIMFALLIIVFLALHALAIVEGLMANGQLKYSHHIIRFIIHVILIILVYKFIK